MNKSRNLIRNNAIKLKFSEKDSGEVLLEINSIIQPNIGDIVLIKSKGKFLITKRYIIPENNKIFYQGYIVK